MVDFDACKNCGRLTRDHSDQELRTCDHLVAVAQEAERVAAPGPLPTEDDDVFAWYGDEEMYNNGRPWSPPE